MKLLDLFSGAGGAAKGYELAGFDEIVGVDINPQPNYPYTFIQADALEYLDAMIDGRENIAYDLIHTSPPCQAFSRISPNGHNHPDLVDETRQRLHILNHPYVIENVPEAPIRKDVVLCGTMFGLQIRRHRAFETSFGGLLTPPHHHRWNDPRAPYMVTGHGGGWSTHHRNYDNLQHAQALMGMPWTTTIREVTEAIPPAYTHYIGEQFLNVLTT